MILEICHCALDQLDNLETLDDLEKLENLANLEFLADLEHLAPSTTPIAIRLLSITAPQTRASRAVSSECKSAWNTSTRLRESSFADCKE